MTAAYARKRVLLSDDSAISLSYVSDAIRSSPSLQIAGLATRPSDIPLRLKHYKPDVLIIGINKAALDIGAVINSARAVQRLSVVVYSPSPEMRRRALLSGAAAVTSCEHTDKGGFARFVHELINKATHETPLAPSRSAPAQAAAPSTLLMPTIRTNFSGIIALGASTGGTEATAKILKKLPANIPPIVIVQHMPAGFTNIYAQRLDRECAFKVVEASGDIPLAKGTAYIAPGGYQMKVVKGSSVPAVQVRHGDKVSGHCPSVDVLFDSVAMTMGHNAIGILLTGMGADGANGLLAMRRRGAFTIGQDEASCVVYGMPAVAYKIGAVMQQVSLDNIASVLVTYLNKR